MPNKEQFLYKITPTRMEMLIDGGTAAESAIVGQHFAYLQELTQAGIILMAGRTLNTDADSMGIVVFYAQDEQQAQKLVAADPAVAQGVMRAKLYPFRVALSAKRGAS